MTALHHSRALWNRSRLDLRSDEMVAQLMDRGTIEDWRALYALAREDAALRDRMLALTERAPMSLPGFWRAAVSALGAVVNHDAPMANAAERGT